MKFSRPIIMLVICLFLVCACSPETPQPGVLVLENVRIIDAESGQATQRQSVLIENGIIVDIAAEPRSDWPAAARPPVEDLYLTPALYDAHVHIFDERDLQMYALYGIQMVRNMDGWPWHLWLRDSAVNEADPRAGMITSGSQMQAPEIADGQDAIEQIESERAAGYDWVKLYDALPASALYALADQGELKITGHLPASVPLPEVLASGVFDDIAHAEELAHALDGPYAEGAAGLDALAADMIENKTALTTTIVNNLMIAEQVADIEANLAREATASAPPLLQVFWASSFNPWRSQRDSNSAAAYRRQVDSLMKLVAGLHRRGVILLAGTDAPNPTTVPGESLHQELAILVDAGLTPAEALKSATVAPADHFAPGARGGRIEIGSPAQAILSRGNPLENIGALKDFNGLVINGNWYPRAIVDSKRQALRNAYAHDLEVMQYLAPDSPTAIFEAEEASDSGTPISPEGLTSLVWFYMKIGNPEAAGAVAEKLLELHPSVESKQVSDYIRTLRDLPETDHEDHQNSNRDR